MVETLYRYRSSARFLLHGFVVMPDHMHLLFSPAASLEQAIGLIKGGFSFAVREQYRRAVWQDGYYVHRALNDEDYRSQSTYIAANPKRRGLQEYAFVHTHPGFEVDPMPPHLSGARL